MLGFSSFAETPYATLTSKAVSGTLAVTLDDITVSATAKTVHNGTLAVTLDDITVSATAKTVHNGTLAVTLDDITFASTGTLTHNGTLAVTLDDITFVAAGNEVQTGILAITLEDIAFAATGGKINSGTLAVTLDDIIFDATGSETPPFLIDPRRGGIKAKKKEYKNNSADVKKAIEDAVEAVTGEPKPKVKVAPKVEEEPNTFVEDYEAILRMETEKAALELAIAQMLEDERDDEEAILLLL
jgi:hypothetical protein